MIKTFLSIYSLLLGVGVLLLGSGLLGTVVALRAGAEGFSETLIGVIMSAFFMGYVLGSYLCPHIIRGVGHIRAFAAMAAVAAAAVILHGLVVDPVVWWFLRIVTGICMMGLYLVIESWLNELALHSGARGKIFAAYMTINLLALGVGQYMILFYGVMGAAPFALSAMFFSLALVPLALTRMAAPQAVPVPKLGLRHLYQVSPLGATGALVTGLGTGAFWGMGAVFAQGVGLATGHIAAFMSAVILGGALLQWPIGHQSDRHDRRKVLMLVSFLGATAALSAYFFARLSEVALLVSALIYGGFSFSVYSLAVAHTNDHLSTGEVLQATRGLLLLNGVGASLGPVFVGVLMHSFGPLAFMLYLGGVLALLGLFALLRMRISLPVPKEEQSEFVPMARTSSVVLELDTRADVEPELDLEKTG